MLEVVEDEPTTAAAAATASVVVSSRFDLRDRGLFGLREDRRLSRARFGWSAVELLVTMTVRDLFGLAGAEDDFLPDGEEPASVSLSLGDMLDGVDEAVVRRSFSKLILAVSMASLMEAVFLSLLVDPEPVFLLLRVVLTGE